MIQILELSSSSVQFSLVTQSGLTLCDSGGWQHARPPCPSPTPRVYSNSCALSRWCHPAISSSVIPFSSCLQSLTASGSFQMSQLFASGGPSIGVSASTSVLPVNIQDWFPLGWTDWIRFLNKYKKHFQESKTYSWHFQQETGLCKISKLIH